MEQSNVPAIQQIAISTIPTSQELMVYETWAKNAVDSQMYRSVGKESAIMMIMLAAREYGIGPAQALNGGLHIIEGKVELSARIMSALIRKSKHLIQIVESTDKVCTIRGKRSDTGEEHTVTFSLAEAHQAGLIKEKGGWKRSPIDMLYARAISRLARQLFSDVVGIGYIEGEISDSEPFKQPSMPIAENSSGEDVVNMMNTLVNWIGQDKSTEITEYVEAVKNHFGWDDHKTLTDLVIDKEKTVTKFNTWMDRKNAK